VRRHEYARHTQIALLYDGDAGERIAAYLLLPRSGDRRPLPAVVAAHPCARRCAVGKEQVVRRCADLPDGSFGLELVRRGFAVIAPDAAKVGERCDRRLRQPWQEADDVGGGAARCCEAPGGSLGAIRWKRVHDTMRAVDLLAQHRRVDATRIGVIGHGLGADTLLLTMAHDERIRCAALAGAGACPADPSRELPAATLLAAAAPRPLIEFARAGVRRTAHADAGRAYAAAGAPAALALVEGDGPEAAFPPASRAAACDWLERHLMAAAPIAPADAKPGGDDF